MLCPKCGAEVPRNLDYCTECQTPLRAEGTVGEELASSRFQEAASPGKATPAKTIRPGKGQQSRGAGRPLAAPSPVSRIGITWPVCIGSILGGLVLGWVLFHPRTQPGAGMENGAAPAGDEISAPSGAESPAASEAMPKSEAPSETAGGTSPAPSAGPLGRALGDTVPRMIGEAGLSAEQQRRVLARMQVERCPCPCRHALSDCNHGGEMCQESLPAIQRVITEEKGRQSG